jgi:hypothetical protein
VLVQNKCLNLQRINISLRFSLTSACSAALESYLPLPLLFSLTNRNVRDDAVTGGVRLIPRRAFSFVSRSFT